MLMGLATIATSLGRVVEYAHHQFLTNHTIFLQLYIYIYTREKRMQLCIARKFYFPVVISINCIIRLQLNISSKHIKIMKIHTWLVSYKLRKQNSTWKGCHPHLENSKVYNLLKGCFRSTGMG